MAVDGSIVAKGFVADVGSVRQDARWIERFMHSKRTAFMALDC